MGMIDPAVALFGKGKYLLLDGQGRNIGRNTATVAVGEGGGALLPVRRQNAPPVAFAHSHHLGCLLHGPAPFDYTVQNLQPVLLSRSQYQPFHGLTLSLNN